MTEVSKFTSMASAESVQRGKQLITAIYKRDDATIDALLFGDPPPDMTQRHEGLTPALTAAYLEDPALKKILETFPKTVEDKALNDEMYGKDVREIGKKYKNTEIISLSDAAHEKLSQQIRAESKATLSAGRGQELLKAIKYEDPEEITTLMSLKPPPDMQQRDEHGMTPALLAAKMGQEDTLKLIFAKNPETVDDKIKVKGELSKTGIRDVADLYANDGIVALYDDMKGQKAPANTGPAEKPAVTSDTTVTPPTLPTRFDGSLNTPPPAAAPAATVATPAVNPAVAPKALKR